MPKQKSRKLAPSPFVVPFDGTFKSKSARTSPPKKSPDKDEMKKRLLVATEKLSELQKLLFADDRYALLVIFQAMDAAGKDGTIRAVLEGVNPAGCQVYSFKRPSEEELDHDFLWRIWKCLPERGRIGILNRSHYEEVLVVRVNPGILARQRLPDLPSDREDVFEQRFESIRSAEQHWARNGTVIVKFWLKVSAEEQRERLLERLQKPESHWKWENADLGERAKWKDYDKAYEEALAATSRPWAPWYAIPADDKTFMRMTVAEILAETLEGLKMDWPAPAADEMREMQRQRRALESKEL